MSGHGSKRHLIIMLLCCLVPLAALIAIAFFRVPVGTVVTYALILLCPLGHLLMMGSMAHSRRKADNADGAHPDEHPVVQGKARTAPNQ